MSRQTHPGTSLLESAAPPPAQVCASSRLLACALQLFAEKGFSNTSVRDLANKAKVNISAISYYFKDKAGLYRAAFYNNSLNAGQSQSPLSQVQADDQLPLRELLVGLIKTYVDPLKHGELAMWRIRLHMREMLEPTGLWEDEISHEILPAQAALQRRLCQELGLDQPDDRVRRLALSIAGLGVHVLVSRDVVQGVAPHLLASDTHIDAYVDQLADYAMAMVDLEKQRTAQQSATQPRTLASGG